MHTQFYTSLKQSSYKIFIALMIVMLALAALPITPAYAATITSTAAGGDWATGSTWVGGVAPVAGDTVTIATTGAGAVTTSGGTITCAGLTINNGATLTMYRPFNVNGPTNITGTINFGSTSGTNRTMIFTGDVTLLSGAVWNETTTGAVAIFSFGGNLTNNATTFTAQNNVTAVHTFTGTAKTLGGTTTIAIPYVAVTGTYTNNGTLAVGTALSGAGTLANAGTLNFNGTATSTIAVANLTNTGTINIAGSGTIAGITNNAAGIVNHSGSSTVTSFNNATSTSMLNISTTPTVPTFTTLTVSAAGNTVNYSGAGNQTVKPATTYQNLTLSGSGTKTTTGVTVNGVLSMEGTAIASVVPTYGAAATLQYNKPANFTAGVEWPATFAGTGGVIVKNTGAITTNKSVGNNLEIATGGVVNISGAMTANTLSFAGVPQAHGTWSDAGATHNDPVRFLGSTANLTVNKKNMTVNATGVNKPYDGATTATVTLSSADLDAGDTVTYAYTSATFADKNVGTGKTVSVSGISISGASASFYILQNTTASTTANITAKSLTVSATGQNKIYDGLTDATVTLSSDKLAGDTVTLAYASAAFLTKDVANGKTVNVSGISISGADAGNYTANTTASATANITAKSLTVSATGQNKIYDGLTDATVTLSSDKLAGDTVTPAYASAAFLTKDVANGKTVNVSGISISGADAGNYTLSNTTASTTANITAKSLTVSATGQNKIYDGLTDATVTLSSDKLAGDTVTLAYASAAFLTKDVADGKTVNVSGISISGADAGNYTANTTASATANITAKSLTVSATGQNKIYDGLTDATVTLSSDKLAGDTVTLAYASAAFLTKDVANGKTVNVSGISISGADAGNYTLSNTTASTTANITAKSLTVSATGQNKIYDGLTDATVTLSSDKLAGDTVTLAYASAAFLTKDVADGKTVNVSGISISGLDAGNYTANTTASTTANITAKSLTVSATGQNKIYDGLTDATVTLSSDKLAGDTVTPAYTGAAFLTKDVADGKTVNVSGISISGTDAGNYTANTTASTTANITAKSLTVSATGQNKIYDGLTDATVTLSSDKLAGDTVTLAYASAAFLTKDVADGKTVNVSGISISGADAGNYTLSNTTASTTANITAKSLTVSATGQNKIYDGLTDATVTLSSDKLAGDTVTLAYASAAFLTKDVADGKTVNVSGISISGADAGNYTANTTASTTANITAKSLTVSATGQNKIYDGLTDATVTLSSDKLVGDTVTPAYTGAAFLTKDVADGKTVNVSGISISGADAGNYTLSNTTASTTANITAKSLTVSATGQNKIYDGLTDATVTLSSDKLAGDTVTLAYASAAFLTKDVADGKTVNVSGISISGADAGNYTANTTASTTANITAKELTVAGITTNDKPYDGNTIATINTSGATLVGNLDDGNVVLNTGSATGAFADANAGVGKIVQISGLTITGSAIGNYTLTQPTTTANITGATLTVTGITASNKTYDGTISATLNTSGASLVGVVSGDDVTLTTSGATGTFDTKNVGNGKTVTVSGLTLSGADAPKYILVQPITNANITAMSLTVSATGVNKAYDATTTATVTLTTNKVAGDTVTAASTGATFDNKNAGTGKTITVTGISISGADKDNYSLSNSTATATADITKVALTVTPDDKVKAFGVDFTDFTGTVTGVQGTDDITVTYNSAGAPASAPVGDYTITATLVDPAGNTVNYNKTLNVGKLTVNALSTFTITGKAGLAGVTLSYNDGGPQTTTSDSLGNYSITIPSGWSGTVTPSMAGGYIFSPTSRTYTNVVANQTNQDYTVQQVVTKTYTSIGTTDGWVLESSETSNKGGTFNKTATTFQLGDDALNRQYKAILSFNTAGIPTNAVIQSVLLQIKQSGKPTGTNPFSVLGGLLVDIRKGNFGTAPLTASDFQAKASATKVATFNKTPKLSWYSAPFKTTAFTYVNKTGVTQLRLYFTKDDNNNKKADFMKFFSGDSKTGKPTLTITYIVPVP